MTDTHMSARATGSDQTVARPHPWLVRVVKGMSAILVSALVALAANQASAQTCSTTSLPYTLANGTTADASQVMADLNCAALYGLAHTTGNVGIGTTAPGANLQIVGSSTSQPAEIIWGNTSVYWPQVSLWFYDTAPGNHTYSIGSITAGSFSIADQTLGLNRIFITSAGNVGIDTYSPSYPLFVSGQAGGTTAWSNTSDGRLKQHIVAIPDALALVQRLRGVRYDWKPPERREVGQKLDLPQGATEIGFIAQEVEAIVPEAVIPPKGKDGVYGLKEAELIPLLVEAIKEQQAEIKQQQGEIEQLRATVASVKGQVAAK